MPLVVNLQRKVRLDTKPLKEFVGRLTAAVDESDSGDFTVAFVSDRRMKELNQFFRGKNSTTDVLSFPHEPDEFDGAPQNVVSTEAVNAPFLGDIVISAEQAERQAKENGLTLDGEIKQLVLHGLLHLCGYDHETDDGEMNKREVRLRKKLGI